MLPEVNSSIRNQEINFYQLGGNLYLLLLLLLNRFSRVRLCVTP